MIDYRLDDLGWEKFERAIQSLLKARLGLGIEAWGGSGDWGRDAFFEGRLGYPTRTVRDGCFLFQCKFTEHANAGKKADKALIQAVRKECERIRARLSAEGQWGRAPTVYALFTNVALTPATRKIVKGLLVDVLSKCEVRIHDRRDVCAWLRISPEVRDSFPELIVAVAPTTTPVRRFASSRLPKKYDTGVFEGRDEEFQKLDTCWHSPQIHVVTLTSLGGAGKSALVVRWAAQLITREENRVERYFDWSFYRQGVRTEGGSAASAISADVFVVEALRFFGDPEKAESNASGREKAERLSELIAQARTLLVLDGIEALQRSPDHDGEAELKDEIVEVLLGKLAARNSGLCVVTSRSKIRDLVHWRNTTAPQWPLGALDENTGAVVLQKLGATGGVAELRQASREVKGHALTLSLMGRYLKMAFPEDPSIARRDCFHFAESDAVQNGHAFRVIAAYERWFETEHQLIELAILRLLGLFDRPATPDCLAMLRQSAIVGLTDILSNIGEPMWNLALSRLEAIGLIEITPHEQTAITGYEEGVARSALSTAESGRPPILPLPKRYQLENVSASGRDIDSHAILREYFAKTVVERTAPGFRAAHQLIKEHLCKSVPYWPEGMGGLAPLYQAVSHAIQSGDPQGGVRIFRDRILRGSEHESFYSWKALGAVGADLAALGNFFQEGWNKPVDGLGAELPWILNEAAIRLITVGRYAEAALPVKQALTLRKNEPNWLEASISASNLSELEFTIGHVDQAIQSAREAIQYAELSRDWKERSDSRAGLGDFLHQQGLLEEASAQFTEAESILAQNHPERPYLYSLRGFRYCDFLLTKVDRAAWRSVLGSTDGYEECIPILASVRTRAESTLGWVEKPSTSLIPAALDRLTLAKVRLYEYLLSAKKNACASMLDEAFELVVAATHGLRQDLELFVRSLLIRAWIKATRRDNSGALDDLNEVLEFARRGPMVFMKVEALLMRARLVCRKSPVVAHADFEAAKIIVATHKYGRREGDVQDFVTLMGPLFNSAGQISGQNQ